MVCDDENVSPAMFHCIPQSAKVWRLHPKLKANQEEHCWKSKIVCVFHYIWEFSFKSFFFCNN